MSERRAVCLPGTLCDNRLFARLFERLPITPTFVDYSDRRSAGEAAAKALDLAPPRFIGIAFSLGGWVLLEMLRRAPERFSAVILISGNAYPDDPRNAAGRRQAVEDAREAGMAAFITANWPKYVAAGARDDTGLRNLLIEMAEAIGDEGHARHAEINIARPDMRAVALASPVPMLVLAGAEDGLCPAERYAAAAEGEQGRLVTLDGVGHFVPLEAPDAAAAAIAAFLKEIEL